MPPLIGAALIAAAPALSATIIGGVTVASALSYGIFTIAMSGASFLLNKLTAKSDKGYSQNQFITRQAIAPRIRGYGRNSMAGTLFYDDAYAYDGADHLVGIVHCEGPVDEVEAWYLNSRHTGIAAGSYDTANMAAPWLYNVDIETKIGTDDQPTSRHLSQHEFWTGTLSGLCYTVMKCIQPWRPDLNFQVYYPNGTPALRIVARCSKVFDPRDVTQNWADASTFKWSRNPALCIMDYLTITKTDASGTAIPRGMGIPKSRINTASFAAFANVCDESIDTIWGFYGTWYDLNWNIQGGWVVGQEGSEPRYSLDGMYDMSESPRDVLNRMLATCDGELVNLADGTIGIRGGVWVPPTFTITDDMILSFDLAGGNDKLATFNQLKISITSEVMDYQVVEGTPYDDVANQDENGVLTQDLSLPMVQSFSQAQRLAKIQMAKGNPKWKYNSLVTGIAGLNALGEENVHVTHSLLGIDQDFRVIGFKFSPSTLQCEFQLVSLNSAAYAWDVATEDMPPPSLGDTFIVETPMRSPIVSALYTGNGMDMGLASDPAFATEDWGLASNADYVTTDLGLLSA